MKTKWKVNFFDKHGTETRTLVVHAGTEDEAEVKGSKEADRKGWPASFKVADAEKVQ